MRVRITAPGGYHDRYGVDRKVGSEADYIETLAEKLIRLGIAVPVTAHVAGPVVGTAKPKPKARRSSRPAKEEAD